MPCFYKGLHKIGQTAFNHFPLLPPTQLQGNLTLMTIKPDFHHPEVIRITGDSVACDGGGGPIGHPIVYLPIYASKGYVECPYCDRRYESSGSAHGSH